MPKLSILDPNSGEVKGEVEISSYLFEAPLHKAVVHQAVVAHLANRRQGTACTKTRGEVRGGGRKPWRQKGTGRARHGSIRSPLWVGGGVVFGPKPRDYDQKLPKKMRRLALRAALTSKYKEGNLLVVEDIKFEVPPKTKKMLAFLDKFGIRDEKTLVVMDRSDEVVYKSARNLPNVHVIHVDSINTYDILVHDRLLMTRAALARIEEVYGGEERAA